MGIDPITHEPLHKEETNSPIDSSSHLVPANNNIKAHNDQSKLFENNNDIASSENSSSPTDQNSSSDDQSIVLTSIGDESNLVMCDQLDDSLISYLFEDDQTPGLVDATWDFSAANVQDFNNVSSWDESCAWLLDCQDFGVHDFGFDCFNEVDTNMMNQIDHQLSKK